MMRSHLYDNHHPHTTIMEDFTITRRISRSEFCTLKDEPAVLDFATAHSLPVLRHPDGSVNVNEYEDLIFPKDADEIDLPASLSWDEEGFLVRNDIQCRTIAPPSILESFPDEDVSSDDEQSVSGVENDGAPPFPPCITETITWPEAQAEVNKQRDLRDAEQRDLVALEARISTRSLAAMWDVRKLKKSDKKLMKAIKRYGGVAAARAIVERAQRDLRARLPDDWDEDAYDTADSSDDEDANGPPPPPPGPGDGHNHNDDDEDDDDDDQPPHRPIAPRLIFPAPAAPQAPESHLYAPARADHITLDELLNAVGGGRSPPSTAAAQGPENPLYAPARADHITLHELLNSVGGGRSPPLSYTAAAQGPENPLYAPARADHITLHELLNSVGAGRSPPSTAAPQAPENPLYAPARADHITLHELLNSVGAGRSPPSTAAPQAPTSDLYAPAARSAQYTLAGLLHTFDTGSALPSTTPGPSQSVALPSPPSEPSEIEEGLELDPEEYIFLHGAQYPVPPPSVPYVPPEDDYEDDLYASDDNEVVSDDDLDATHTPVPGASTAGPGDAPTSSIDDEDDLYAVHAPFPVPASTSRPQALQSASAVDDDDDIYVADPVTAPVASTSRSGDAAYSVPSHPVDFQVPLTASTPPIASRSDEAELPSDIPGLGSLEPPPSTSIHDEANDDLLPFADRTRRQEHRALLRAWERQMRLRPSWVHPPSRIVLDPLRRVERFPKQFGLKRHSEYTTEMQRRAGEIVDLQLIVNRAGT
ncbi:hypothetical protein BDZ89DRAFT_371094 [Hymenopellis radicata]|nr:hypothetical protein BDZ89DRAFT_371094 [Hymenopellis radicata]